MQSSGLDGGPGALSDGKREMVGLAPIAGGMPLGRWCGGGGDGVGMGVSSCAGGGVTLVEGGLALLYLS